jgi:hypothetical protein
MNNQEGTMQEQDRIYIPARRARLGLDKPNYRLRHLSYALLAAAALSAAVWWRLS